MRIISFHSDAFDEYNNWVLRNKKIFNKIIKLIKEIKRTPFEGIGKPEPLKGDLQGLWSRHINDEHRIIYQVTDTSIIITSCKYHYD